MAGIVGIISILSGALLLLARLLVIGRRPKGYPPGPPTLPVLGNLHQIRSTELHKQLQKWAQQYGSVFTLMLGTKTMVVLSSDIAVKEVLDKQSAITNERGDHYVGHEILSGGERMLLMPAGPKWRLQRKMMQRMLNVQVAKSYLPYNIIEGKQMLYDLLQSPDDFLYHIKRYSNSLSTSMTYGWRTPTYDDPTMRQFLQGMEYFTEVMQTTTASLVDVYPVLRYLPHFMQPTLKAASNWHKEETKFYLRLWNDVKEKIAQGTANPCFTADLLQAQKEEAFPDKFGAYLAGGSLEAGTDTTSNTLYGFVQAMVLFPDVQKAAQAELDRVVGGRLPVMEDLPELRYIRSCVKESLRWMPTAITGAAPHAAKQDIQFMGYVIPKGSLIVNNVYTIHNDPKRYPNPKKFDPARYLNDTQTASEAALNSDVSKRDHFTFGAGRRLCAGMHVAEQSLFLGISHILWAFDIRPAKDENTGKDLLPDQDKYTEANVCMPAPYSAIITPRSEQKAEKIREEWHKAQNELTEQGQWKQIPQGMKFNAI